MKEIDARGLACPAPVLQARAAVEQEGVGAVRVIVDNDAARQNVTRYLESRGMETEMTRTGDDFVITGKGDGQTAPIPAPTATAGENVQKILILAATDRIGSGDDNLGRSLMVNFVKTLKEMGPDLWHLVFVNNGVKLAVDGSEVIPELRELEENGVKIMVCGTCLSHFNLLEKKAVGETTNMLDIVTAMQLAEKVINL